MKNPKTNGTVQVEEKTEHCLILELKNENLERIEEKNERNRKKRWY